jgi:hypothetical protein
MAMGSHMTIVGDVRYEKYMAAVGHVAMMWANYELNINSFIWELSNVECKVGTCTTSQLIGPGPRFRCLLSLLRLRNAPQSLLNAFNKHHEVAEKLSRQRNRFMHDPMVKYPDGKIGRLEFTADKHVRHDFVHVELDEVLKLFREIEDLDSKFDQLYFAALKELPPWPRGQYEISAGFRPKRGHRSMPPTVE